MSLTVTMIPVLEDNYAYLVQSGGETGIIDPGEAQPVIDRLEQNGLSLDWVVNTHHHWDHTDGNRALLDRYKARWAAPAECGAADEALAEGTLFHFGDTVFDVFSTPGHTDGHVCLYNKADGVLFSGDTLFSMGCGRLFEGTPEEMFKSLQKIRSLPGNTRVYCGHEYTLSNAEFARHILPGSAAIQNRYDEIKDLRAAGRPTVPVSLSQELQTNPFLIADSVGEFTVWRKRKDNFI